MSLSSHYQHSVQFYENSEYLAQSVAEFAHFGLLNGEGVILFAIMSHRQAIEQILRDKCVDVDAAFARRQLHIFDAHEFLQRFLVSGLPDKAVFGKIFGKLIGDLLAQFPSLRIFGEMVNILSAENNIAATLELEGLWNDLLWQRPISLLCAYRLDKICGDNSESPFRRICNVHSHVTPTESYETAPSETDRLRLIAELQRKAMALQYELAERRCIERKLQESEKFAREALESEAANVAKSTFLASMSHEIRTPLSVIIGYSDLLSSDVIAANPQLASKYAETIKRNATHLASLVDNILDISKIESGRLDLEIIETRVRDELDTVITLLQPKALERHTILEVKYLTEVPEVIATDPTRLRQILINLIGNAIKFTEHGRIDVVVSMAAPLPPNGLSSTIVFTVTDSGCGISPEYHGAIFDAFCQSDQSINRKFGGTGLGLSLSRHLAQLLGGEVKLLKSAPDKGSTFEISINTLAKQKSQDKQQFLAKDTANDRKAAEPIKGTKVLVAEDFPDLQLLLKHMITG